MRPRSGNQTAAWQVQVAAGVGISTVELQSGDIFSAAAKVTS
jgi:hypothetical protein